MITEKSKHTVFKLISISVSSLNELSQSGFFWLVGFCYQASSEPCQQPQQCDIRYKQEHASSSDSPTHHLVPLCHAGFCLHKLLMKHQDGSVARGIIDFCYDPATQMHTSFTRGQKISYASSNENRMDNYKQTTCKENQGRDVYFNWLDKGKTTFWHEN